MKFIFPSPRLGNIKSGNSFHKFHMPYALVQDAVCPASVCLSVCNLSCRTTSSVIPSDLGASSGFKGEDNLKKKKLYILIELFI
jgi:hypothetical protein